MASTNFALERVVAALAFSAVSVDVVSPSGDTLMWMLLRCRTPPRSELFVAPERRRLIVVVLFPKASRNSKGNFDRVERLPHEVRNGFFYLNGIHRSSSTRRFPRLELQREERVRAARTHYLVEVPPNHGGRACVGVLVGSPAFPQGSLETGATARAGTTVAESYNALKCVSFICMIKDIIIHVWGEAEREPFGHTRRLSRSRAALSPAEGRSAA